ncbi:MAG: hypothetical protein HY658_05515 [Actinobacteria bacterium]|nr:hypothetical protein [Actinomycetota bacterium]
MRCREARQFLPSLMDEEATGELGEHVSGCRRCQADLAVYGEVASSLSVLEMVEVDPPAWFLQDTLSLIPSPTVSQRVRIAAAARPVRYAAASVGGAVVGAGAIGLWAWRRTRRAVSGSPQSSRDLAVQKA